MDCIVTQGWGGWARRATGATIRPSMPAIQPSNTARIGLRYGQQRARAAWMGVSVSRYNQLYHDRGKGLAAGGCVTIQSLYRDRRAVWLAGVSRYNQCYRDKRRLGNWLCRDTTLRHGREGTTIRRRKLRYEQQRARGALRHGRACAATRPAMPATLPALGLRQGTLRATTRRHVRAVWVQCTRPVRAAWVQGVHLVHPTQF